MERKREAGAIPKKNEKPSPGSRKGLGCKHCNPPATTTKCCCTECGVAHLSYCPKAGPFDPDNKLDKRRLCYECKPSGANPPSPQCSNAAKRKRGRSEIVGSAGSKAKQTRSGQGTALLPALGPNHSEADVCKGESCIVHDLLLLSEETPATSLATASVRNAAKLVVVSISADKTLLDTSESADERLGRVMHSVKNNLLHPEGTVAVFVPLPWFTHMGRLHSLRVEESVLVLNYKSRGGGRPSTAGRDDLKATNGCVMLAHLPPAEGRPGYTCNKRVTPADIHGHGGSVDATGAPSSPVALSIMSDLTYEGANVDIPRKALTFLINRFTKQGDTVASVGAESNACVEVALGRGRRLEAFVGKESARDGVEERARESFVAAYAEGFFKAAA